MLKSQHEMEDMTVFPIVQEKCRAGLKFVHVELVDWLWFAIG